MCSGFRLKNGPQDFKEVKVRLLKMASSALEELIYVFNAFVKLWLVTILVLGNPGTVALHPK